MVSVKVWCTTLPPPEAVRPAQCPGCGAASQQPGKGLTLYGHGVRERQQRGPDQPGHDPEFSSVLVRRYRCLRCRAVSWVGPRDVLPRYLHSGPAIAWALALVSVARMSTASVRRRVSPWRRVGATAHGRWPTLARWVRDVQAARLFGSLPTTLTETGGPWRAVARRVAVVIAAQAPPKFEGQALCDRAFFGARTAWLVASG